MTDPDEELRRLLGPRPAALSPPPGAYERIVRRARRRRWARAGAAMTSTAVIVGVVAVVGVAVERQTGGGGDHRVAQAAGRNARALPPRPGARSAPRRTTYPVRVPPTPTPAGASPPAGVRLVDLTWVSTGLGWGLGVAPCGSGSCTAVLRTGDGGWRWARVPAPRALLGTPGRAGCTGTDPCVSHLRFANTLDGYAYGPALFTTDDGGATWVRQRVGGPVQALEPGPGSVVAVVGGSAGSCVAGCEIRAGGLTPASWRPVGPTVRGSSVQLVRAGYGVVAVLGMGGGAPALYVSENAGETWSSRLQPCHGGRPTGVAAGTDGSLAVACLRAPAPGRTAPSAAPSAWVVCAPPGRFRFGRPHRLPGSGRVLLTSPRAGVLLAARPDALLISTDAGRAWATVLHARPTTVAVGRQRLPGLSYVGFESTTIGRVIEAARTVLMTTDGGERWTATHRFR